MATCECGCAESTHGGQFLPGHDQRLRAQLESRVGGLLALRALIESVEAYAQGRQTSDELTATVRRTMIWRENG